MADIRERIPLVCEPAATNRSSCKITLQPIAKGEMKVSAPMFAGGRTVMASFKAPNFLQTGFSVDEVNKGNAGKCKMTKRKFEKGDLRCRVHAGMAKFNLSLKSAKPVLQQILAACSVDVKKDKALSQAIVGLDTLPAPLKARVINAMRDKAATVEAPAAAVKKAPATEASKAKAMKSVKKVGQKVAKK